MRKLLALFAVVAIVLTACSSESNQASQETTPTTQLQNRDVVLASVQKAQQTSAKVDVSYTLEGVQGQSSPMNLTGTGAFDMASGNGSMTMQMPVSGMNLAVEMRIVDDNFYFKYAGPNGQAMTPTPWLSASVEEMRQMGGNAAMSQASNSPADGLKILQAANGDVTEVGKEDIRGSETTRYKVELDPAEMSNSNDPAVRDQATQLQKIYGTNTIPADIWIDSQGQVARVEMTIDLASIQSPNGASPGTGTVRVRTDIYDYGTQVDVAAPPAGEITPFGQAMSAMGGAAAAAG